MKNKSRNTLQVKVGNSTVPIYSSKSRGKPLWQVPTYPDGKTRQLRTFSCKDRAVEFAQSLVSCEPDVQSVLARISTEDLKNAAFIGEMLAPFCANLNITVEQAIHEYIAAKTVAKTRNLLSVLNEYLQLPWITKSRTPWLDVVKEFLTEKASLGCRPETIRTLGYALEPFGLSIGNPPIGDVTKKQLHERVHRQGLSPRGNKTTYAGFHNLYAWAKRNGYVRTDIPSPMDAVASPKVDRPAPAVITPELAEKAIKAIVSSLDPEMVILFVIPLFTGIRADELQRLTWDDVNPNENFAIPAKAAKTRLPRSVPILPVLAPWITPFYGHTGLLSSRRDPQLLIGSTLVQAQIPWKRNWLRHSYASYRLRVTNDIIATALECGHSPATLTRYYLSLASKARAQAYFKLTPEACGISDWDDKVKSYLATTEPCHFRKRNKRRTTAKRSIVATLLKAA